jgi:hypothetical protein
MKLPRSPKAPETCVSVENLSKLSVDSKMISAMSLKCQQCVNRALVQCQGSVSTELVESQESVGHLLVQYQ